MLLVLTLLQMLLPPAGGVISGVLRKPDGTPAVGTRVAVMAVTQPGTSKQTLISFGRTDESGRYRLDGVPPGAHYVVAGRVDLPTFYPGELSSADARTVVVASGSEVSGVDFVVSEQSNSPPPPPSAYSVRTPPLFPIAGRVVLADASLELPGSISFSVTNELLSSTPNGPHRTLWNYVATARVQPDGSFQVLLRAGVTQVLSTNVAHTARIMIGSRNLLTESADIQPDLNPQPELVITLVPEKSAATQ